MSESRINLDGISFETTPAERVSDSLYSQLYDIEEAAFSVALPNDVKSHLMFYMGTVTTFTNTRRQPRLLVASGRVNAGNVYSHPEVTVAYEGARTIGYAYCADNVSGNWTIFKQLSTSHNYRWLRTIAVHPDYQGRGVAHGLVNEAYSAVNPERPATAYTWPAILPRMSGLLNRWGFEQTLDPPQPVNPFYMEEPIDQYRYKADHVSDIQRKVGSLLALKD